MFPYLRHRTALPAGGGLDRAFEEDGSGNRKGKRKVRAKGEKDGVRGGWEEWVAVVCVADGRSSDAVLTES